MHSFQSVESTQEKDGGLSGAAGISYRSSNGFDSAPGMANFGSFLQRCGLSSFLCRPAMRKPEQSRWTGS